MYNRYIPSDADFLPIEAPEEPVQPERPQAAEAPRTDMEDSASGHTRNGGSQGGRKWPGFLNAEGLSGLFGRKEGSAEGRAETKGSGLSGLLRSIGLEDIDSGDVLLLLIILYLLVEGDDLELVIALGLVLLMGLGDSKK